MEAALAANPPMVHHPGATTIPMPKVFFFSSPNFLLTEHNTEPPPPHSSVRVPCSAARGPLKKFYCT
jgi:hypothetical protein